VERLGLREIQGMIEKGLIMDVKTLLGLCLIGLITLGSKPPVGSLRL